MAPKWWIEQIANPYQPVSLIDLERAARWLDQRVGYVYLIHMENTPFYKIGASKEPMQRAASFASVLLPVDFPLIHSIQTNDMFSLEKSLHERFGEKRQRGEWFTLNSQDIEAICAITVVTYPSLERASERVKAYETAFKFDALNLPPPDLKTISRKRAPLPIIDVCFKSGVVEKPQEDDVIDFLDSLGV